MERNKATLDRRETLRVSTQLPFQWRKLAQEGSNSPLDIDAVLRCFALAANPERDALRRALDDQLASALDNLTDPHIKHALALFDQKLDLALQPPDGHRPAQTTITLSVDGIEFESAKSIAPQAPLAIHLVLPDDFHFCALAYLTRCDQEANGYRCGARFESYEARSQKVLARFVMLAGSER